MVDASNSGHSEQNLIRELFNIFSSLNVNLTLSEAMEVSRKYQNCILSFIQSSDDRRRDDYRESAAFWSLCTLCFLQSSLETPVHFVHDYIRWIQFYYSEETSWMDHLANGEIEAELWGCLVGLVAVRNFEQASVLLRRLILDRTTFYEKAGAQVELLLGRLLEAPSPSQTLQAASTFTQWLSENRVIFAEEIEAWEPELRPTAALLIGDFSPHDLVTTLEWKKLLCAVWLYKGIPTAYEEVSEIVQAIAKPSNFIESLMSSCLRLSLDEFIEQLREDNHKFTQLSPQWLMAHLMDLLTRTSLVSTEESKPFIISWALKLGTSRDQVEMALEYCRIYGDYESVRKMIASLDDLSLLQLMSRYGTDAQMSNLIRSRFNHLAHLKRRSGQFVEAYHLASQAGNTLLMGRAIQGVLDKFATTNDTKLLQSICLPEHDYYAPLISWVHNYSEKGSTHDRCLLVDALLQSQFKIPPSLLSLIVRDLSSVGSCKLSRPALSRLMEIIDSPVTSKDIPPDTIHACRVMILKNYTF